MSNVNLSGVVKTFIENAQESKKECNKYNLKLLWTNFINKDYAEFYKIFTDGSKDQNYIGAAFLDPQTNSYSKFQIDSNISIMCAELIAIYEALSYIESVRYHKFVIFCDSKSALQHLLKCLSNARCIPVAYNIIKCIRNLNKFGKDIILQWVPAHIGITDNERVDCLAKEASSEGNILTHLPFFTNVVSEVKSWGRQMWKEYFDERSLSKGVWYKTIQPTVPKRVWFEGANMSQQDIVLCHRLRSGHIPLNSFAALMGKIASPNCVECNVVEDVYHILAECVRNEAERYRILNRYNINVRETGICNILAFPLSREARMLYNLVKIGIRCRA